MEDEDQFFLTEKGLFMCMEMHQKVLCGWTLEQVADFYDMEVTTVRVALAAFYMAADQTGVDLGIYVPDTIEGLD